MVSEFDKLVKSLEPKYIKLVSMTPVKFCALPRPLPKRGIYLFSEGNKHLYVGRTNRLRERLRSHCVPSATHFTATFAFRLAREESGFIKATYKTSGSRAGLVRHKQFGPAFSQAKARVAQMDIRYIEETDAVSQALLEIYVATDLKTPYNDFDNH